MKNRVITSIAVAVMSVTALQAQQLEIPKPSPTQHLTQEFAIGSIEVAYSRPGLKGRTIGTDFVPYGKLWRTGANGATTITFTDAVTFGTTKVTKGTYGLLSIPNENEWTVILTSDLNVNLPSKYQKEHDIASVTIPVTKLQVQEETFSIDFAKFTLNSCELQLRWDHSLVSVPISTDIDSKITKQIDAIFQQDSKPYYAAAQYYFDTDRDLNQAKTWIEKATADEKHANMLHMFWLQAQIYEKLGETKKAKATAKLLIEKATKLGNQDYVTIGENFIENL
ncbi:Protein of unknown function [Pustulibacterium marinum]|uniref:DUF2911 domain-containing protein n=1 Tax=Pustulibacterium marinum TaxID=1224947 RepID=A0A1I7IMK9_9FLAO|nr:DUF2911 domain-containing protein [Pustulibacterium marinum]SFU74142.1 Protein of unknown function [Pustulibacterium marinum]